MLQSIAQDLRYAIRGYRKTPVFAAAVVATLAVGIGTSTAIFSAVNGILLRPLPYQHPERLVFANEVNGHGDQMSVSWPNFLDWRDRASAFESLAASRNDSFMLTGGDRAERLAGRHVSANFFRALGIAPVLGRDFGDADDRPGATPVAIVSNEFWRHALGGRATAIGDALMLDDRPHVVVGVLPPGFTFLRTSDIFVSMGPISGLRYIHDRGDHAGYFGIGRLRPGVTLEAADADLRRIAADLRREHPDTNADVDVRVQPLLSRVVADVRGTLLAIFSAVGLLLFVSCVNVASLLIARGAGRRHELAVRAAIGGGRWRIIRQLLVESTLVSLTGGALGVALASGLLRVLIAAAPEGTPRLEDVHLDLNVLVFALGATAVCGILFGLFPALQASSISGQEVVIRGRAATAAARTHRLRRALMVAEIAFALVLLMGAGLVGQTLRQLTRVDAGFRADHLLTLRLSMRGERWRHEKRVSFLDRALADVRALPGIRDAAVVSALPIDGSDWNSFFIVSDKPVPHRQDLPSSAFTIVSPRYFQTMETPVIAGRTFDRTDGEHSAPVIVVNASLARRIWPGENPIGKRLKQGWPESTAPWREVVGVVGDVKLEGLAEQTPMQVYMPASQEPSSDFSMVVRTTGPPAAVQVLIEAAVRGLDAGVPLYTIRTMEGILNASLGRERMSGLILSVFAFVALTLASLGLYGLVSHGVTERTHEIGIRMALGAEPRRVAALVIRQGMSMALGGVALGLAGAIAFSRSIQGLLFGVKPTDPVTFGAMTLVLLAVTAIACCVPAWRATRLDPTQAMRAE